MKRLFQISLVLICCLSRNYSAFSQTDKYALIIGVKSYIHVPPLRNSLNDAQDMASLLKKKGFTVIEVYDPKTKRELQDNIKKYFALIEGKPQASGLVFYSGHGMQVKGVNYLIPTLANPEIEADLEDQCLNMDYVMRAIEQAGNGLNIFILDACRNNPFRSFSRSTEKGLNTVETPKGSYIVYATKPGSVASDGTGRNGLFTSKLLQYLNTEGLNIEQVFKQVARDVATASGDGQRPWIASDYTGDFFFTPSLAATPVVSPGKKDVSEPPKPKPLDFGYGPFDVPITTVGSQVWSAKNLNVDRFANGDVIPHAKTDEEWQQAEESGRPAWCYYSNDSARFAVYGKLYNWHAVNDPRGLAPPGWHVPSEHEWDILQRNLAGSRDINVPESSFFITWDVAAALKNTSAWSKGKATNVSGFNALPTGSRYWNIRSGSLEWQRSIDWARFWSSTEIKYWDSRLNSDLGYAWSYNLNTSDNIFKWKFLKMGGLSVRCVKD